MSQVELNSLLIRHLADLEDAIQRVYELQDIISKKIDNISKNWAENASWLGGFNWQKDTIWVAPREWARNVEEEDFDAWFEIDFKGGIDRDHSWLTTLCRIKSSEYGFHFRIKALNRKIWASLIQDCAGDFVAIGFVLDDKRSLFLPLHIEAEVLAEAIANGDVEPALEPLKIALGKLQIARPLFDGFLEKLKTEKQAVQSP